MRFWRCLLIANVPRASVDQLLSFWWLWACFWAASSKWRKCASSSDVRVGEGIVCIFQIACGCCRRWKAELFGAVQLKFEILFGYSSNWSAADSHVTSHITHCVHLHDKLSNELPIANGPRTALSATSWLEAIMVACLILSERAIS